MCHPTSHDSSLMTHHSAPPVPSAAFGACAGGEHRVDGRVNGGAALLLRARRRHVVLCFPRTQGGKFEPDLTAAPSMPRHARRWEWGTWAGVLAPPDVSEGADRKSILKICGCFDCASLVVGIASGVGDVLFDSRQRVQIRHDLYQLFHLGQACHPVRARLPRRL